MREKKRQKTKTKINEQTKKNKTKKMNKNIGEATILSPRVLEY